MVYVISRVQKRPRAKKQVDIESIGSIQKTNGDEMTTETSMEVYSLSPELFAEIEKIYEVATSPVDGELVSFPNDVWKTTNQRIQDSLPELNEEITQVYIDVGLANNIVWLVTEYKFRSDNISDQYAKLCSKIAARLDRIMPLLKKSPINPELHQKI
jgi:hypothetical protein